MAGTPIFARSRSPVGGRSRWSSDRITRQIVAFGRYRERRPLGLDVDASGAFRLDDLMESWGREVGLEDEEVVEAVRRHMLKEDSAALRFSIREGEDERLVIRVHPKSAEDRDRRDRRGRRDRRAGSRGLLPLQDRDLREYRDLPPPCAACGCDHCSCIFGRSAARAAHRDPYFDDRPARLQPQAHASPHAPLSLAARPHEVLRPVPLSTGCGIAATPTFAAYPQSFAGGFGGGAPAVGSYGPTREERRARRAGALGATPRGTIAGCLPAPPPGPAAVPVAQQAPWGQSQTPPPPPPPPPLAIDSPPMASVPVERKLDMSLDDIIVKDEGAP